MSEQEDHEQKATNLLARLTSEALAGAERPPTVQQIAVEGRQPGRVLVTCSKANDVLVVGSRGRGPVASALLGSSSDYCVHHAPCRVVVIPPGPEASPSAGT
jgi:nucleotide-binding universal stress UspA family protein